MTDDLGDLRQLTDAPSLKLPIGGKTFVVKPCNAADWLRLQEYAEFLEGQRKAGEASPLTATELYRLSLGDQFDAMIKHVTGPEIEKAGMTAWFWQIGNVEAAKAYWASGGKAPRPRRSTSTSTAGASTTRTRASGSGTTSRRRSSGSATKR